MPQDMQAVINFRLADGDTVESVMEHCRAAVQDPTVELRYQQANDPSATARRDGYGYRTVVDSMQRYYPDVVFVPSMTVGATDAHQYEQICDTCLRCSPFMAEPEEAASGVHGTNERIPVPRLPAGHPRAHRPDGARQSLRHDRSPRSEPQARKKSRVPCAGNAALSLFIACGNFLYHAATAPSQRELGARRVNAVLSAPDDLTAAHRNAVVHDRDLVAHRAQLVGNGLARLTLQFEPPAADPLDARRVKRLLRVHVIIERVDDGRSV